LIPRAISNTSTCTCPSTAPSGFVLRFRTRSHDDRDTINRSVRKTGQFEDVVARLPEVVEASLVTGEYDYYIKLAVSGTAGYERFLREKLYKIPGMSHTRSSFTLRCLKRTFSVQLAGQALKDYNSRKSEY